MSLGDEGSSAEGTGVGGGRLHQGHKPGVLVGIRRAPSNDASLEGPIISATSCKGLNTGNYESHRKKRKKRDEKNTNTREADRPLDVCFSPQGGSIK